MFDNFTAYPFKKALGITFQIFNFQLVTELSRKSKEQIVFLNNSFGFFQVITVYFILGILYYFRLDNEISLYYLGSQGVWKYL